MIAMLTIARLCPLFAVRLAALAWLGLVTLPAHPAALTVIVTDATGKPLADAVALLEPAAAKAAVKPMADVEISQAKREFAPRVTLITVGTRATFPNFDTVRHHVYSFSPAKTFELKLYAGVPGVPVVFDKPGIAVLGCNIHDNMAAWVVIVDTPYFGRSAQAGTVVMNNVPPGSYRLRVWHPGLPVGAPAAEQALVVGPSDLATTFRLGGVAP